MLNGAANLPNRQRAEVGGKHVPAAVDEVMGFVDEKEVVEVLFGKMPAEVNLWVKDVVVIADDQRRPTSTRPEKVRMDRPGAPGRLGLKTSWVMSSWARVSRIAGRRLS